ncbi:hypothetical protein Q428_01990 [Fervidicella metallireducens AeB]|uniref:General stress protein n=1 Tax=Fervidicella metallireducens AeB TaxID=1403537 RepID=A0A017RY50_9CLOT|nr:YtxH domain-containing protein [Fervidicella metallireducens]EYE89567.1 hypothetical protein Q428_01990 [Fervidicella metallireducens AeB]
MVKKIQFDINGKKRAKKNLAKGLAIGAAAGTAIGALAGLIFAPKSGKETRNEIKENVTSGVKKAADEVKNASSKIVNEAKKLVKKEPVAVISSDDNIEDAVLEAAEVPEEVE